jgi:hypothetical protein
MPFAWIRIRLGFAVYTETARIASSRVAPDFDVRHVLTWQLPIQVPQTLSGFHRTAQRNVFPTAMRVTVKVFRTFDTICLHFKPVRTRAAGSRNPCKNAAATPRVKRICFFTVNRRIAVQEHGNKEKSIIDTFPKIRCKTGKSTFTWAVSTTSRQASQYVEDFLRKAFLMYV